LIDLNKSVLIAVRTGRVILGSKETIKAIKSGRGRLVIVSSNCPMEKMEDIAGSAKLSGMTVYAYPGSAIDLGEACGKPFAVAAMIIREPGDSDILKLTGEETGG
jgi:large subunit ribosomal protein L30e